MLCPAHDDDCRGNVIVVIVADNAQLRNMANRDRGNVLNQDRKTV
jgi:hypothetical protein